MKITTNTKDFCKLLQVGGAFAGKNKVHPLSAFVKITTKGYKAKIESSDYQNSIKEYGELVECDADGVFFVNFADLYNYLAAVTSDIVTLTVDAEKKALRIVHNDGEMSLPIENDGAFVDFPSEEGAKSFDISRATFEDWTALASSFAANDQLRPTLSGMYVFAKDGKIGYCATDAHNLITNSIDAPTTAEGEEFNFIIDASSLNTIQRMLKLKNVADTIKISAGKQQVFIKIGTATMSCRLAEGNYPPFERIIPQGNPTIVTINRDALISAVKRASLAKDSANKCTMRVEGNVVGVHLEDVAFAKTAEEKVSATLKGDNVSIGVNYILLINCLSAIKSDTVKVELKSAEAPLVFKDDAEPNQVVLLMPMM